MKREIRIPFYKFWINFYPACSDRSYEEAFEAGFLAGQEHEKDIAAQDKAGEDL